MAARCEFCPFSWHFLEIFSSGLWREIEQSQDEARLLGVGEGSISSQASHNWAPKKDTGRA
jgi:hypothetical protein